MEGLPLLTIGGGREVQVGELTTYGWGQLRTCQLQFPDGRLTQSMARLLAPRDVRNRGRSSPRSIRSLQDRDKISTVHLVSWVVQTPLVSASTRASCSRTLQCRSPSLALRRFCFHGTDEAVAANLLKVAILGGAGLYDVEGGHGAIVFNRIKDKVLSPRNASDGAVRGWRGQSYTMFATHGLISWSGDLQMLLYLQMFKFCENDACPDSP
ncbi:hypothetical protein OPV22_020172 [Ensete ventricosum]|uniref:Uncharacterized protein n=1 Tax=Ensete ventricosum TaxID=4639 RepID=A0AAV8QFR8_ENSVE|nr:hypothetical protein OPV22_020172 [Ensete ventricosum]